MKVRSANHERIKRASGVGCIGKFPGPDKWGDRQGDWTVSFDPVSRERAVLLLHWVLVLVSGVRINMTTVCFACVA